MALKGLQALAEQNDVQLSVGDFEREDLAPPALTDESDGPQPIEVASRVVAHVFHRIPGVKRIEKRFEGRDKSSGIGSDIAALALQIYARNEAVLEERIGTALHGFFTRRAPRQPQPQPGASAVMDLGVVDPEVTINPHENGGGI